MHSPGMARPDLWQAYPVPSDPSSTIRSATFTSGFAATPVSTAGSWLGSSSDVSRASSTRSASKSTSKSKSSTTAASSSGRKKRSREESCMVRKDMQQLVVDLQNKLEDVQKYNREHIPGYKSQGRGPSKKARTDSNNKADGKKRTDNVGPKSNVLRVKELLASTSSTSKASGTTSSSLHTLDRCKSKVPTTSLASWATDGRKGRRKGRRGTTTNDERNPTTTPGYRGRDDDDVTRGDSQGDRLGGIEDTTAASSSTSGRRPRGTGRRGSRQVDVAGGGARELEKGLIEREAVGCRDTGDSGRSSRCKEEDDTEGDVGLGYVEKIQARKGRMSRLQGSESLDQKDYKDLADSQPLQPSSSRDGDDSTVARSRRSQGRRIETDRRKGKKIEEDEDEDEDVVTETERNLADYLTDESNPDIGVKLLLNLKAQREHSEGSSSSSELGSPEARSPYSTSSSPNLNSRHTKEGLRPELAARQGRDRQVVHLCYFVEYLYHFLPVRGLRPNEDEEPGRDDLEVECANEDELEAFVNRCKLEEYRWYTNLLNRCMVRRNPTTLRIYAAMSLGALSLKDLEYAERYFRKCCRILEQVWVDEASAEAVEALTLMSYYAFCTSETQLCNESSPSISGSSSDGSAGNVRSRSFFASYLAQSSLELSRNLRGDQTIHTCALRAWSILCGEMASTKRYSADQHVLGAYFPQLLGHRSLHYNKLLLCSLGITTILTRIFLLKYFRCEKPIPLPQYLPEIYVGSSSNALNALRMAAESSASGESLINAFARSLHEINRELAHLQGMQMGAGEEVTMLQGLLRVAEAQCRILAQDPTGAAQSCYQARQIIENIESLPFSEHAMMAHLTPALDILASSKTQEDVVAACKWMHRLAEQFMIEETGDASFVWDGLKDKIAHLMTKQRFLGQSLSETFY